MYRLQCKTQSYDWGKLGDESKVAQLAAQSGMPVDPAKPYAELWMGTHPNAPSIVKDTQQSLGKLIQDNVSLSTQAIYDQYAGDLPFLFKILSIRKALSIQAHPDKVLGARLFKEFPAIYKDPNHKPEMAIALTPFEALCGFRPLEEIAQHLVDYPEFSALVGDDVSNELQSAVKRHDLTEEQNKVALKAVFSALMKSSETNVADQLATLLERLTRDHIVSHMAQLIQRLDSQYPGGDVGVFAVLMLNYVEMQPGQAIFLGANEPHAYLSGDCVECMAASDNVVRAGLTPKFKDVDVLVNMLTYRYGSADSQKMTSIKQGDHSLLYDPPIEEFAVLQTCMEAATSEKHTTRAGPSILIVTQGHAKLTTQSSTFEAGEGHVYFIGAGLPLTIETTDAGITCYRAFTEIAPHPVS